MSNTKRRKARHDQRPVINRATRTGTDWDCPHCRAAVELFEKWQDWYDVLTEHGVKLGGYNFPPSGQIAAWWFCCNCGQGGACLRVWPSVAESLLRSAARHA